MDLPLEDLEVGLVDPEMAEHRTSHRRTCGEGWISRW
jgi:hypothetical protein